MKRKVKCMLPALIIIAVYIMVGVIFFGGACTFKLITGIPCPGCGMTRAAELLITGHPIESINMHPMLIPMISAVLLYIYESYYYADGTSPRVMWSIRYAIVLCVVSIIIYIVRMYMFFPLREPYIYYDHNFLEFIRKIIA